MGSIGRYSASGIDGMGTRAAVFTGAVALAGAAGTVASLVHTSWISGPLVVIAVVAILVALAVVLGWPYEWIIGRWRRRQAAPKSPARTEPWRHVVDGIAMGGMSTGMTRQISHPGEMRTTPGQEAPAIRVAARIACDPLRSIPGGAELRSEFLAFLGGPAVERVVRSLTSVPSGLSWQSWEGNGRLLLAAVLTGDDTTVPVLAWAMASFNDGQHTFGLDDRCADFLLLVRPRNEAGQPSPPATLERWRNTLIASLALPESFSRFLATNGMRTYDEPPAKFGFSLAARPNLTGLIDITAFRPINGSTPTNSIISYAVADRSGQDAETIALEMLRLWLEYGVRVEGYETEVDGLASHS